MTRHYTPTPPVPHCAICARADQRAARVLAELAIEAALTTPAAAAPLGQEPPSPEQLRAALATFHAREVIPGRLWLGRTEAGRVVLIRWGGERPWQV